MDFLKSTTSPLQAARRAYQPKVPKILSLKSSQVGVKIGKASKSITDQAAIQSLFPKTYGQGEVSFVSGKAASSFSKPLRVALALSGGQAPGGHNVVAGLFDGLKKLNKKNTLTGYLGGPSGLVENKKMEVTDKLLL